MSSKSWYALKSKSVHTRYGLSKNIQTLLQGLERYHEGIIDVRELGSMVRLSPKRRESVATTISKCANMIKKDPQELKTCVDIIEMCTEILEIAGRCLLISSSRNSLTIVDFQIDHRQSTDSPL
jgi:hypothetical protein